MGTQYNVIIINTLIQSSGITQNNQLICSFSSTPRKFCPFWPQLEGLRNLWLKEWWAAGSLLHCNMIAHNMDQNRKKNIKAQGYWIEGVERKFRLKIHHLTSPPPSFFPSKAFKQTASFHCCWKIVWTWSWVCVLIQMGLGMSGRDCFVIMWGIHCICKYTPDWVLHSREHPAI